MITIATLFIYRAALDAATPPIFQLKYYRHAHTRAHALRCSTTRSSAILLPDGRAFFQFDDEITILFMMTDELLQMMGLIYAIFVRVISLLL